jgi:hypothetical protein
MRRRKRLLENYLLTVPPDSKDREATERAIHEIAAKLQALSAYTDDITRASIGAAAAAQPERPLFSLSVPASGRTNISVEPTLTWTEDRRNGSFQSDPPYKLRSFRVVIARDRGLREIVHEQRDVTPAAAAVNFPRPNSMQSIATSFSVPEDKLEPGERYFWQVFAVYVPRGSKDELEELADNGPYFFITSLDPFRPLTKRNFSLQRTVDSTDPTEGAQFSFLKTFGGDTVFSTDFAFFWDSSVKRFAKRGEGDYKAHIWFRPAVEGRLTSDNSQSEDAWRFSGLAVIDYNFIKLEMDEHRRLITGTGVKAPRKVIDSLYFELGGVFEGDQDFDTRKLTSRFYVSPSSRMLAIGTATGRIESPIQFMWRPSFEFNAGHTFEGGDSAETGKTVLRMVPRARFTLYTRGLSRLLRVADTYLYADNTFYYLPKDDFKKRHNYFVSGFEVLFIKNFGFGLTYKNGESAPKFRRVNTFGGVLTIRFGPE